MNYIYDILLNFHDTLYDFYDWNPNDNIINIRKMPLIKISSLQLKQIMDNTVQFDHKILNRIENRTELFIGKDIQYVKYCFLLSDGSQALAVLIKNNMLKKSHLLVDEELEVIEVAERLNEEKIDFQIVKKENKSEFKTRKEKETEKRIRHRIKELKENGAILQLKYLYYECFDKKEEDIEKIILDFNKSLDENNDVVVERLSKFFELLYLSK